jgi:site-specific DNA-methyltransferase (adenine-specific)
MTTPYYQDDLVKLYHGKFEDVLPDLGLTPDLLIADPPYGETSLEWDVWPSGWPAIAAAHARSMWTFGSLRMFFEHLDEFADWKLSQDVVWEKHNGSSLANDRFSRVHEYATHWYRGPWAEVHHDTPVTMDATARTVRKKARPAHWQGAVGNSTYVSKDGGPRLMRSVIYARSMHGRAINETEKPVELVEPLLHYGCPAGGLVVDIFAGSGSTGAAAKALGRRAVLIERRESQCEAAARRLAQDMLPIGSGA